MKKNKKKFCPWCWLKDHWEETTLLTLVTMSTGLSILSPIRHYQEGTILFIDYLLPIFVVSFLILLIWIVTRSNE